MTSDPATRSFVSATVRVAIEASSRQVNTCNQCVRQDAPGMCVRHECRARSPFDRVTDTASLGSSFAWIYCMCQQCLQQQTTGVLLCVAWAQQHGSQVLLATKPDTFRLRCMSLTTCWCCSKCHIGFCWTINVHEDHQVSALRPRKVQTSDWFGRYTPTAASASVLPAVQSRAWLHWLLKVLLPIVNSVLPALVTCCNCC